MFLANISYAQFSMPKISVHKKENTSAETITQKVSKTPKTKKTKPKLHLTNVKKDKPQATKQKNIQPKEEKQPKQTLKIFTKQKEEQAKKNESQKTVVKTSNKIQLFNKKDNKIQEKKHTNIFSKHTKAEKPQETTTTSDNIELTKKNKLNIKNPFKKKQIEVGEDLVSKEQIKEELTRVHNLSQQAVALYTDNNLDDSLNTFLKIPEKYRTAQDYVLMGNILADLGRREDAIFMYKRAILTDEFNYKAYYNIGNICLNDDKYFMAIDYYKKAKKYASDFPYVYYNLGCAYIKAGDLKRAKSNLTKAIELKNTEPDFHYNLAYVYKKLDKPKLAKVYLENYNKLTNGQ